MSKIPFLLAEFLGYSVAISTLSQWFEVAPERVLLFFILSRLIVRDYKDE